MAQDRKDGGISRRACLGGAALVLGGGAAVLASSAAWAKTDQKSASYQDKPKDGKKCSGCAQFQAPKACTVVEGDISPEGWCQFYVAKSG